MDLTKPSVGEWSSHTALAAGFVIVGIWGEAGFPTMSNFADAVSVSRPFLAAALALILLGSQAATVSIVAMAVYRAGVPWFSSQQIRGFERNLVASGLYHLAAWLSMGLHVLFRQQA